MEEIYKLSKSGIKSKALNTRDSGYEHETNDCVVKALAAVTGVPYRDAHSFCKNYMERKDRKGCVVNMHLMKMEQMKKPIYGFRSFCRESKIGTRMVRTKWGYHHSKDVHDTLSSFVRKHKTGRYLLCSNYHAFACIDGVIHDNGAAGPKTQVTHVFEFITDSECERRNI